jgi:hypothetical protein
MYSQFTLGKESNLTTTTFYVQHDRILGLDEQEWTAGVICTE